jgi:hypothetical protein
MLDSLDAVLGGWFCKVCGKFTPKLEPESQIICLEKPAKIQSSFKEKLKGTLKED